jgi:hypothetical protein
VCDDRRARIGGLCQRINRIESILQRWMIDYGIKGYVGVFHENLCDSEVSP